MADGTYNILCQELNSHQSEEIVTNESSAPAEIANDENNENNQQNSDKSSDDKIKASDLINRLKANSSVNNSNKRQSGEEINDCSPKKIKKAKKNAAKGLPKFFAKHYDNSDQKDCETLFNTSFNKYGREIVPRSDRPDFTQLFVDENNEMDLTKVTEISEANRTSKMELTLNQSIVSQNVCQDVTSQFSKTHHFSDQSMITESANQSLASESSDQSVIDNANQTMHSEALEQTMATDCSSDQSQIDVADQTMATDLLERTMATDSSNQSVVSEDANDEVMPERTEELESIRKQSELSTLITPNKSIFPSEPIKNLNLTKSVIESEFSRTHHFSDQSMITGSDNQSLTSESSDESMIDNANQTMHPETIIDSEDMPIETSSDFQTQSFSEEKPMNDDKSVNEKPDSTKIFVDESNDMGVTKMTETSEAPENRTSGMELTLNQSSVSQNKCQDTRSELMRTHHFSNQSMNTESADQSPASGSNHNSSVSRLPKPMPSKIPQPAMRMLASIRMPNTKSVTNEAKKQNSNVSMAWLAQTTAMTNRSAILPNTTQQITEHSVRTTSEQTHTVKNLQISNIFKRVEQKSIQKTEILETTKNISVAKTIESPPSQPIRSVNATTIARPNRQSLTARMELSKSVVKDMFGLGMTERLKQKREELEAKRNQSQLPTAFTPNVSNSVSVSEKLETLSLSKNVSQLSTDLFNSKSKIETEDMDIENECISESDNESESQSLSNSSETEVSKSKSHNEVISELISEQTEDKEQSKINNSKQESESSSESKETSETCSTSETDSNPTQSQPNSDVTTMEESDKSDEKSASNEVTPLSTPESSFNLTSLSPISTSVVHSSDPFLVSSPTLMDPTLNFTFHNSDSEDSFDPFIHTNQSFHANHTFYESSSPLQLSFMVREDTLCLLADELERQLEDIVIPVEDKKLSVETSDDTGDMFGCLKTLDPKKNGFAYEVLSEEKALISYLWGTFALEIRFGDIVTETPLIRKITSINMKSLISAEEPLQMRQRDLVLRFDDSHKPLITVAHDLIISSFESEKQQITARHKTTESLRDLVSYISFKALSAKKLLTELRIISSSENCRLYPKQDDRYRYYKVLSVV